MYNFYVSCWVNPRSGFELALRNKELKVVSELCDTFDSTGRIKKILLNAEKKGDGMIFKDFKFEFPVEVSVSEIIMPLIRKDHPEARLINHDLVKGINYE